MISEHVLFDFMYLLDRSNTHIDKKPTKHENVAFSLWSFSRSLFHSLYKATESFYKNMDKIPVDKITTKLKKNTQPR